VLSTAQGTTAQVIGSKTQALYFNQLGKACKLMARRLEDDRKMKGKPLTGPMDQDERDRNAIFVFSIPLKQKELELGRGGGGGTMEFQSGGGKKYSFMGGGGGSFSFGAGVACFESMAQSYSAPPPGGAFSAGGFELCAAPLDGDFEEEDDCVDEEECCSEVIQDAMCADVPGATIERLPEMRDKTSSRKPKRGMDHAMLEVGSSIGDFPRPFKPSSYKDLKRDERFPIRCTIQLYRCTDSSDITRDVFQDIQERINKLYNQGSAQGSLVVDADLEMRPTAPTSTTTTTTKMGGLL
jgi:hypothetical protein